MILRPEQLAPHLERPLQALYTLHGDEPLLVLEAADAIRAAARGQGYDEREILVVGQGFRRDALTQAAGNLSLFGSRKLIELRIPTGKPGREGADILQSYVRGLNAEGTVTLVTLPEVDWQTRKTAWFQALGEHGVMLELNAPERARLPHWIASRLAAQGQSAQSDGLAFIAEHVEGNLLAAHQEILKLGLLYPQRPLSTAEIRDAVLDVARYDVDKLRFALLEGDPARCVRLLEGLKGEGTAPPLVLWALTSEIRTLAALRSGLDARQPLPALLKAERVFDEARKQALQQALSRLSQGALKAALLQAARIDRMIKGIASGDLWDEFQTLTLRLARRQA